MESHFTNNKVSVIVPTFCRPDGIRTALRSLLKQKRVSKDIEVLVIDNDPKASAKSIVHNIAKKSKLDIRYLHEPNPGVSNARNMGLDAAQGRYLVFLDDDQEANPDWISSLLRASRLYKAALVFGPCIAHIPQISKYLDFYKNFFSREAPDAPEGLTNEVYGCGNSLIDRSLCNVPSPAFSPEANDTGGEDDLLFAALLEQNINVAWAPSAEVIEHVSDSRATPIYVRRRSFAFGQSPTQACADCSPPDIGGIVKWTFIGLIQYCLFRPISVVLKLSRHPSYIKFMSKSYEGAGKMLWFGIFKPKLYGAAALNG